MTALVLRSISSNVGLIGGAWMLSSSVLTTYYTNRFLKYDQNTENIWRTSESLTSLPTIMDSTNEQASRYRVNPLPESLSRMMEFTFRSVSRAQLLTLFRFSISLFIGLLPNIGNRIIQTRKAVKFFMIPALFLFIANYCNSIALERIGISLTYTSKCAIPLVTVLLTLWTEGLTGLPPLSALLSLIPIAVGIAMASWNSPVFELYGFVAAIVSTISQACLNIYSKKAMIVSKVGGLEAQRAMVCVALGITICMAFFNGILNQGMKNEDSNHAYSASWKGIPPIHISMAAAVAYHIEYVLSFIFVKLVHPISFGAVDAVRRLGIILAGRVMFGGEQFSTTNHVGVLMTLLGAFLYSLSMAK